MNLNLKMINIFEYYYLYVLYLLDKKNMLYDKINI